MSKTIGISVGNPMSNDVYKTNDLTVEQFERRLNDIESGNRYTISFYDVNTKHFVSISPKNCANIDVYEIGE